MPLRGIRRNFNRLRCLNGGGLSAWRRRVFLSRKRSSCASEQLHSDANLEAVDRRSTKNSKNGQWMTEGDVSVRRSTPTPQGGE
ncbi:hypothetical protein TNCV_3365731 [Trichonephila clavipes]|nr:hypothetical protein TNCV_3365731 [Trichonephila clavipes]